MSEGMELPAEQSPDTLLLFLSFDVVGSTAYKQRHYNDKDWVQTFKDFFKYLKSAFDEDFGQDQVKPFKYLGDELILVVDLGKVSLSKVLSAAYDKLLESADLLGKWSVDLSVKAAAWLVYMDGARNVWLVGDEENNLATPFDDVLGANMDEGFRVSSNFARQRQLVLSFELAWLLCDIYPEQSMFYYARPRPLKGVWSNAPYPVIWYSPQIWRDIELQLPYSYDQCELFREMALREPIQGRELRTRLERILNYHEDRTKDCTLREDLETMEQIISAREGDKAKKSTNDDAQG
nr:hypothetical protein 2 [bacterium]